MIYNSIVGGEEERALEKEIFPRIDDEYESPEIGFGDIINRFLSIGMYGAIVIATTGWSGWDEERNEYWRCKEEDLSERGKVFLSIIRENYGGLAKVVIVTGLDT